MPIAGDCRGNRRACVMARREAVDSVLSALPGGFPEEVAASVADGIRARIRILDQSPTA
jgi:hypothetical protein